MISAFQRNGLRCCLCIKEGVRERKQLLGGREGHLIERTIILIIIP